MTRSKGIPALNSSVIFCMSFFSRFEANPCSSTHNNSSTRSSSSSSSRVHSGSSRRDLLSSWPAHISSDLIQSHFYLVWPHLVSLHPTSSHFISYVISPHLISSHLISAVQLCLAFRNSRYKTFYNHCIAKHNRRSGQTHFKSRPRSHYTAFCNTDISPTAQQHGTTSTKIIPTPLKTSPAKMRCEQVRMKWDQMRFSEIKCDAVRRDEIRRDEVRSMRSWKPSLRPCCHAMSCNIKAYNCIL